MRDHFKIHSEAYLLSFVILFCSVFLIGSIKAIYKERFSDYVVNLYDQSGELIETWESDEPVSNKDGSWKFYDKDSGKLLKVSGTVIILEKDKE